MTDQRSAATKCCYRSSIVLDFNNRVTFRSCTIHGDTEHVYQPARRLTLRDRWRIRQGRRRLRKFA